MVTFFRPAKNQAGQPIDFLRDAEGDIFFTLQHTADPTLQNAACCNTLQHTAAHCNTLQHTSLQRTVARCSTLRAAAHCTLQQTVCCSTLQHTTVHNSTLQHTPPTRQYSHSTAPYSSNQAGQQIFATQIMACSVAVCCSVLQRVAVCCSVLQCVAVCCSVLQRVAVCCSVLQCCRS